MQMTSLGGQTCFRSSFRLAISAAFSSLDIVPVVEVDVGAGVRVGGDTGELARGAGGVTVREAAGALRVAGFF
jgi:hypothetical protein